MKKIFTLLVVLALAGATVAQAQVLRKSANVKTLSVKKLNRASNQVWWGYADANEQMGGLGVQAADTYHCAIYIPGTNAMALGKAVRSVRFFLDAPHAADVKAWLSTTLPSSADAADVETVSVSSGNPGGMVEASFTTGKTIAKDGLYVGYTFTITEAETESDMYPIAVINQEDVANALLLRTDNAVKSWSDMNGQGYGRLYMEVQLEGDFATNAATPATFRMPVAVQGGTVTVAVPVSGGGVNAVESIDYTVTTDGATGEEQHAEAASPIAIGVDGYVNIELAADDAVGQIKQKTLTITKVNGKANEAVVKTVDFSLATVDHYVDHRVVVEEYTGTGCGWCPRGIVGMEKLNKQFGDAFVGIAIHQYNSADAMYMAKNSYASLTFEGAPQCTVERRYYTDPYYGITGDIIGDVQAAMDYAALVGVEVEGVWNDDQTQVNATATVESLIEGAGYNVEFVLVGDGLKGSGTAWNQANFYNQYTTSQLPADLKQFGSGGANGNRTLTGWTFNDVALCSSYVSGSNQAQALENLTTTEPATSSYTLTLPTKTTLKNAIKQDKVYVVALLVNSDGVVENAAKAKVVTKGDVDGIAGNKASAAVVTARYTLDGRRIDAPQRGLNIVKMSDGTIRKVMVK